MYTYKITYERTIGCNENYTEFTKEMKARSEFDAKNFFHSYMANNHVKRGTYRIINIERVA